MRKKYDGSQSAEAILYRAYKKSNKSKDRLLLWTMTAVIVLVFLVTGLGQGKIQADKLRNIRSEGMTASAYLENGTKSDLKKLDEVSFISELGREKFAGKLLQGRQKFCDCVFLDHKTYQKMIRPSLIEIQGKYPEQRNEIMLSKKTLTYLGIDKPEVGMKILLDFYWSDPSQTQMTGSQEFILSGYFTDLKNELSETSTAYISEKRMKQASIAIYPCRILIETNKKYVSGERMEKLLYQEMNLKEGQQFAASDSADYQAVEGILGSYGMMIFISCLLMLSMFLFVYNVLYISMGNDIRQYGLLRTIGVTGKQIKRLVYRQMVRVWIESCMIGGVMSALLERWILPRMIGNLYLGGIKDANDKKPFHLLVYLLVCLGVGIALGMIESMVLKKLILLSPLESLKFEETNCVYPGSTEKNKGKELTDSKRKKHRNRNIICELSWNHVTRSKRKFLFTVFSLALGGELPLCASVIGNGTNMEHRLAAHPDFTIGITQESCTALIEIPREDTDLEIFPESFITEIQDQAQIKEKDVKRVQGFIPIVDTEGMESLEVLNESEDPLPMIQVLKNSKRKKLKNYIKKNDLNINFKKFEKECGTIILHNKLLPQNSRRDATEHMGSLIGVSDLVPVGTDMTGIKVMQLNNCGYLDISQKEFPEIGLAWDHAWAEYLLVSEDTFNQLRQELTPQIFQISFNVDQTQEPAIKRALKQWTRTANMNFQQTKGFPEQLNLFYLDCTSDNIAKEKEYIQASSMIMNTISAALLLIGITSFLNTIVTDILMRKKEFMLLKCVGMTQKQIRQMLIWEGAYFAITFLGLLTTIGNAILLLLGKYMKTKLKYFVFVYPGKMLALITICLLMICILSPKYSYKRVRK